MIRLGSKIVIVLLSQIAIRAGCIRLQAYDEPISSELMGSVAKANHPLTDYCSSSSTNVTARVAAFWNSVALVVVSGIFDKTFFVAFVMTLQYRAMAVFPAALSAQMIHSFIAGALGCHFVGVWPISMRTLNFMAASLFLLISLSLVWTCYNADADSDAIGEARQESKAEVHCDLDAKGEHDATSVAGGADNIAFLMQSKTGKRCYAELLVFTEAFLAIFLAEWGDRSQISLIGLYATQPGIFVLLGSLLATVLLIAFAVGLGSLSNLLQINFQLRTRVLYGICAVCFLLFALLAFKEGFTEAEPKQKL